MVGFHFLVLPNMACPRTLSRIYLGIWFWGTHGVMNIVLAILPVSIVCTLTIQCGPVFGLRTSVKLHKPANHFWLNPSMVKCHVSPCRAYPFQSLGRSLLCDRPWQLWLRPLVANCLTVLDRLRKEELVASVSKIDFFGRSVEFCGHVLENGTRRPAPGKMLALDCWGVGSWGSQIILPVMSKTTPR